MTRLSIFLFLLLTASFACQLQQERAMIHICNAKYVTDCNAMTRRAKRGDMYRTNFTVISKHSWGNNVTFKLTLYTEGMSIQIANSRVCEIKEIPWLYHFITNYSNMRDACPYPPGVLGLYNLEFSAKNIPSSILSLGKGKVLCKFLYEVTKTQEPLVESSLLFRC
nr:uncharacterized protein LOC110381979 [Helicoverpa armigera]